jgi:hypothetical protein
MLEVMEQLRAKDDVHTPVAKGKGQRIGADGRIEPMACGSDETLHGVGTDRVQPQATPAGDLARPPRDIGEAGAHVQERGFTALLGDVVKERPEDAHNGPSSAKEHVRAFDITMRPLASYGIDISPIEDLRDGSSSHSDQRSSCA